MSKVHNQVDGCQIWCDERESIYINVTQWQSVEILTWRDERIDSNREFSPRQGRILSIGDNMR